VGLCIAVGGKVSKDIVSWGLRAKKEVLVLSDAAALAEQNHIFPEEITGTHRGITASTPFHRLP
jgi:hypothetical protein